MPDNTEGGSILACRVALVTEEVEGRGCDIAKYDRVGDNVDVGNRGLGIPVKSNM